MIQNQKNLSQCRQGKTGILGIPYDGGSSFMKGSGQGPAAIRGALFSPHSNLWTESGVDLGKEGLFSDLGDADMASPNPSFHIIEQAAAGMLDGPQTPVFLGGDHSITHPIISAFSREFNDLKILHFDAHPDLYDELDGNREAHACPFARIMEENLAAELVQVGIRTLNGHQRQQARRFGVKIMDMRHLDMEAISGLQGPLYLSIDLDALDPAHAPGVSHHEPGGLSTRQLIDMIDAVNARVVGADIVELNPARDFMGVTAMVAAKILKELAGKIILQG